jgi:hypothetical protein
VTLVISKASDSQHEYGKEPGSMDKEINVLVMVKGEERFIFLYEDERRAETLRMLGRYAADPDINFTWYDAAVLSQKIRQASEPATKSNDAVDKLFAMDGSPFQR